MSETVSVKSGEPENLASLSKNDLLAKKNEIITNKIPVFRMNVENKLVIVPIERLDHYLGDSSPEEMVFYIEQRWLSESGKKTLAPDQQFSTETTSSREKMRAAFEKYGKTAELIDRFCLMSIVEREEILDKSIEHLHEYTNAGGKFDIEAIIRMVEVVANTFYANYANVETGDETDNVKNNPMGIYVKTEWVIKLIVDFFKANDKFYKNYNMIDDISTGSYTIDHMIKGVLWFTGFFIFYNDYIDKGLVTKKIRANFKDRHIRYYRKRFPEMNITVEKVIKDGLRRIDMEKELTAYALGALLYDIGKLPFIMYHDSTDDYDENIVKMHVLAGYNMIRNIKNYPFTVSAMTVFHHEYYGGKGSYNFTNPILSKLTQKKQNEEASAYFVTYDEREFMDRTALSYFPCKVIEVIDVYNALVHKKANSPADAFKIMKKNFMSQSLKIDPIIFDIFIDFKIDCGQIDESIRKELDAIF